MLSNNKVGFSQKRQHFSIRKLTVGAASVLIGTTFYLSSQGHIVHADTLTEEKTETVKSNTNDATSEKGQSLSSNEGKTENLSNNQKFVDNTNDQVKTNAQTFDDFSVSKLGIIDDQAKPKVQSAANVQATNAVTYAPINVNDWDTTINLDGEVYLKITGYHGTDNISNLTIPNGADFAKAGKNFLNLQAEISHQTLEQLVRNGVMPMLSGTDGEKIKAEGSEWGASFSNMGLTNIDGLVNLDTSNIKDMDSIFAHNHISDLTSLANWNVGNVTFMLGMFQENDISDLTPLTNWNVNKVTNMSGMFNDNDISDLTPLANWNVKNVKEMLAMFDGNHISDLSPLANWNVGNVTNMYSMFESNDISDLSPLANWNVGNVISMYSMFASNDISDLTPLANWNVRNVIDIRYMFYANKITSADFSKWNFSNLNTLNGDNFYLAEMVPPESRAVIYLGANDTISSWFLKPLVNDNIFTTSTGNHLIVTSIPTLLANPNKAFNKVRFSDDTSANIPVFINAKNTKKDILNTVKSYVDQAIHTKQVELEQKNPNKLVTLTLDPSIEQNDPIALANAKVIIKIEDKAQGDTKKTSNGAPLVQEALPTKKVVIYKDKNGNVIGTQDVEGKVGDKITLKFPDGYTHDGDLQEVTIPADGMITINNVIKKASSTEGNTPKNDAIGTPLVQEALPTKKVVIYKDKNGNVIGTQDVEGKVGDKVTLKFPDGYTHDGDLQEVTIPADGMITINNVIKKASSTEGNSTKNDATGTPLVQNELSPKRVPVSNTDIVNTQLNLNKAAIVVDHNANRSFASPDSSTHKAMTSNKHSKLPQTGTSTSALALAFGTLVSGLGLLGLKKLKKHN